MVLDAICRQTSNIKHIDRRLAIPYGPHGMEYNCCRKAAPSEDMFLLERYRKDQPGSTPPVLASIWVC